MTARPLRGIAMTAGTTGLLAASVVPREPAARRQYSWNGAQHHLPGSDGRSAAPRWTWA
jgi:hypothetical protein